MPERTTITIIDVLNQLGKSTHKSVTWPLGDRVRDKWKALTGADEPPGRPLTPSTDGTKRTHCIANYPLWFRPYIVREIEAMEIEGALQADFWYRQGVPEDLIILDGLAG